MKADQLLTRAAQHMQDRAATYDKPGGERSMGKAVQAFNAITGRDLSEPEGWLLLQVLKDVRLFQHPGYHADSAEDCIAYAALKAEAKQSEAPVASSADPATVKTCCGDFLACTKPCVKRVLRLADKDGWIGWGGGECPVPAGVRVEYVTRVGYHMHALASSLRWNHIGCRGDIVRFRVIQPAQGPAA